MKRKPMKLASGKEVDPRPLMMRGETEFEEARMRCEFELIFKQTAELGIASLKETYEFMFRKAYFTGKAAGKRESLGSPEETLMSPQDASVRETAGAQKEQSNGVTESD